MTAPFTAETGDAHIDDVVGVEVTIDGMLVIADKLGLTDFPPSMGIRLNIPQPDLRKVVWEQVERDLSAQGVPMSTAAAPRGGRHGGHPRACGPHPRMPVVAP